MNARSRTKAAAAGSLAVLLAVPCAGCNTTSLWAKRSTPDEPVRERSGPWDEADAVGWRIALTPLAVGVDVVTLPLQLLVFAFFWPQC